MRHPSDRRDLSAYCQSLMERAQADSCTTGKSTIGDEKSWNVFMRLDTAEARYVSRLPYMDEG